MSTSIIAKTRLGSSGEIPSFINSGGVVSLSATANLSPVSSQDNITNSAGTATYTLPSGNLQIGVLKEVTGASVTGGTVTIVPPAGCKIINGAAVQASASFAATGASVVFQYVALGTWKVVRTAGTITFA